MKILRPLTWKERLLCLVFPARCLGCGRAVLPQRLFCEDCVPKLPKEPFSSRSPWRREALRWERPCPTRRASARPCTG